MGRLNGSLTIFAAILIMIAPAVARCDLIDGGVDGSTRRAADRKKISAAALVKAVYDSQAWIDSVRSFYIRTHSKASRLPDLKPADDAGPPDRPPAAGRRLERLPQGGKRISDRYNEFAWDQSRVRRHDDYQYEGEGKASGQTTIWDGKLAIECAGPVNKPNQYVIGNQLARFFGSSKKGWTTPWGPGCLHQFWWQPFNVREELTRRYLLPEDFEFLRQENVNGRDCYVVLSRAGAYTMCIGVADGRLHYRTLASFRGTKDELLAIYKKIGGPTINTVKDWNNWTKRLEPAQRERALREAAVAEFDNSQVWVAEALDDYREVAPGCWLAFRQTHDSWLIEPQHYEEVVTEVRVNQPLPDDLFRFELHEGVPVNADWRYNPPIQYEYRNNQTDAERIALRDAEVKRRKERRPRPPIHHSVPP